MSVLYKHWGNLLVFCTVVGLRGAINIDAFSSVENDRYANDAQFIMNQYDLSGVAIANDGRFVTMVSDNVFLSAHHFYPSNGTSVTFYASNDPAGASATRTIQSSQRIGTTDIRIGVLSAPLSSSYKSYDFSTEDITSLSSGPDAFTRSDIYQENAFILGRSPTAFPFLRISRSGATSWTAGIVVSQFLEAPMRR